MPKQEKSRARSGVRDGGYAILIALLSSLIFVAFVLYTQLRIEHRGEYPKIYLKWEKIEDVKVPTDDMGEII